MKEKKGSVKKINIKNKKEATKNLNKKNTPISKKNIKKSSKKQIKKVVKNVEVKEEIKNIDPKLEKINKKIERENAKKAAKELKKSKKDIKKAKIKGKEPANKLILPKEWQAINTKAKTEQVKSTKIKGKLRSSIFEEVDERTLLLEREKNRKTIKKTILVILILAAVISIGLFLLIQYNEWARKKLNIYETYSIGDKVILKDSSVWYVVDDSAANESTVRLLRDKPLDINDDGKLDDVDKKVYNSKNQATFDPKDEESVAKYLDETYKTAIQDTIGKVDEATLLTSKEFVKIREKMGFGYEWSTGNWLADSSLGYWWVVSDINGKVYAVGPTGVYKIFNADSSNFVRPVIVIGKEAVKKEKVETEPIKEIEEIEPLPGGRDVLGN